jgi:hypothetical protein
MAFEKRYTAKQVAEAVLKTTQNLLVKAEEMDKCGTFSKVHRKAKEEGYSEQSADKIAGKAKAMDKSEMKHKLIKDGLSPNEVEAKMKKYEPTNPKKDNAKPSEHDSQSAEQPAQGAAPKGEAHHAETEQTPKDGTATQAAPEKNPKEQAEGNNELAGTTPTQVGQDGKNVPGGDEIRGHLKLAKFIGRMEHKRSLNKVVM